MKDSVCIIVHYIYNIILLLSFVDFSNRMLYTNIITLMSYHTVKIFYK